MAKKVLFISHDALRTGAPIVFLHFLRWFKENTKIPFKIILRNGGPLEPEFAALAPVLVLNSSPLQNPPQKKLPQRIINRLRKPPTLDGLLQEFVTGEDIGLIYSNTITNHAVLSQLAFLQCPIISHIHELESWIYRVGAANINITNTLTTHFIAVSNAVKDNLVTHHAIPDDRIDVIYGFVPMDSLTPEAAQQKRQVIRRSLNIPENAFVVGGSGTLDWRKGSDLFVQLARTVRAQYRDAPIYFLWLGGDEKQSKLRFFELQYDLRKLNLENVVYLISSKPNPLDYFTAFDIFALLSREDPYPLVCLEAASLEKPILCFDQAGGEKEFVEEDCGFVIPYLDIATAAEKVHLLFENPALRQQLGQQAAQKGRERHAVAPSAAQIMQVIQRFL
jgi:glycosyltransferase involved in cell wall biosynthesis